MPAYGTVPKKQEKEAAVIPGRKYRIISGIIPGVWNKPREMVFRYVGEDEDNYIFSARPEAGTQELPKGQIAKVSEVDDSVKIMLPRIYRG